MFKIVQHLWQLVEGKVFDPCHKEHRLDSTLFTTYNLGIEQSKMVSEERYYFMAQVGLLEDNARIAKLCATMLHYAGHQVTIYDHPRECLQALLPVWQIPESKRSLQDASNDHSLPVEVLILDLHLPDIDGVEVLRYLQSHPRTRSLPLIFCTAAADAEIARALSIAPRASLVEKPFRLQTLISAIASVLKPV